MSRQSQTNTFNDGMNKDLTPLLTPNTVMTDCLNGTIATYNGNEFALQNDLGNYKFENGKLSDGFVPIGVKEYANTLYIVSYNPIDDEVEIGSFPSAVDIYSSDKRNGKVIDDVKINLDPQKGPDYNYSDIDNNGKLTLLTDATEDYKLNPGDLYSLTIDEFPGWQKLSYFILSESNKTYDITSYIETNDWHNVKWDVSGWLAVKNDIIVMKEFNYYISKLTHDFVFSDETPKSAISNISYEIKLQTIWDNKFVNNVDLIKNIVYKIKDDDTLISLNSSISSVNKYTTVCSVFNGYANSNTSSITIVPGIKIDEDKYIWYDNFETTISLEHKEWNSDLVSFGNEIFNYSVNNDSVVINFDIDLPLDTQVKYKIKRYIDPRYINDGLQVDDVEKVALEEFIDDIYIGQNILNINFDKDINYSFDEEPEFWPFDKEDHYTISFIIGPRGGEWGNEEFESKCYIVTRDLWASEYINYYKDIENFYSDKFKLDDNAFLKAVKSMSKAENIFDFTMPNKDIIEAGDSFQYFEIDKINNIIGEFINTIPLYSTNKDSFNGLRIKYGSSYLSKNIDNINIDFPKLQSDKSINGDRSGRLWSKVSDTTSKVYYKISGENFYTEAKKVDNGNTYHYEIPALSSVNINTILNNISTNYPVSESNYVNMYSADRQVSKDGDWYKLNYLLALTYTGSSYNVSKLSSGNNDIRFNIFDDNGKDGIRVCIKDEYVGDVHYDYKYINSHWICDYDDNAIGLDPWFINLFTEVSENLHSEAQSDSYSRNLNSLTLTYFIPHGAAGYINSSYRGDPQPWWDKNSGGEFLSIVSENVEKYYGHDVIGSSGQFFLSLSATNRPYSGDIVSFLPSLTLPWLGMNNSDSNYKDIVYQYIRDVMMTFMISSIYLKGCLKPQNTTFYLPKLDISWNSDKNIIDIDAIKYNISIDNYKYPRINNTTTKFDELFRGEYIINNNGFTLEESMNTESKDAIIDSINKHISEFNKKTQNRHKIIEELSSQDIKAKSVFIDINSNLNEYVKTSLSRIAGALEYDSKFHFNDIDLERDNKIYVKRGDNTYYASMIYSEGYGN